jgi:hypothetical protein
MDWVEQGRRPKVLPLCFFFRILFYLPSLTGDPFTTPTHCQQPLPISKCAPRSRSTQPNRHRQWQCTNVATRRPPPLPAPQQVFPSLTPQHRRPPPRSLWFVQVVFGVSVLINFIYSPSCPSLTSTLDGHDGNRHQRFGVQGLG